MSVVKDVALWARISVWLAIIALAVAFTPHRRAEPDEGVQPSGEADNVISDVTARPEGVAMSTTGVPRQLWQIDHELRQTSMAKASTGAGDLRRRGAMDRIDELLDERLVAEAEQLISVTTS